MRKILIVLLMVLGLQFAALSVSGVALSQSVFNPGESGSITLTVSNLGDTNVIETVGATIYGSAEFDYTSSLSIGDMNPGTSTTVSIPIRAREDAKSGITVFDIRLNGFVKTSTESNLNVKSASVSVPVLKETLLSIGNYGNTFDENTALNFVINNNGGAAKNARLGVLPPFAIYGTNEVFLGQINGTKSVSLNLNVVGVNEGQNTLSIAIRYSDELGNDVSETKNISLGVRKERVDLSFIQNSNILAKKDSNASFRIVNGAKNLMDVRLSFPSDITIKQGSEVKVGNIASGQTKEISFPIYTELSPGTRSVNATIIYIDDGKEKTKTIPITLEIKSDSNVRVFVDAKPAPVTSGQEETLSVTVANTWDYPIESTSVRITGDFFNLLSAQDEQYIGLLNKDDFSSVQFKVSVKPEAASSGNLVVYVNYKEPSGNLVERQSTVKISISPNSKGQELGIIPLIAGIVILGVAGWWFFLRKKK